MKKILEKFNLDEPENWIMFGILSLILLYIIAVVLLNIITFAEYSTFHGFNPFPAFEFELLPKTMTIFIVSLLIILISLGNVNILKGKPKSGYSEWATEREIKKQLKKLNPADESFEHAGLPLVNDGKNVWVDDGEFHTLVLGSTGSGKTQAIVQPLVSILARKGESMIITDPKGEIYRDNAELLKECGYDIIVLNFRNPIEGNSWNPLAYPYKLYKEGNIDKAIELVEDLAVNMVHDEKTDDPFWSTTSGDFFSGLTMALFEDAEEQEININSIAAMTNSLEEDMPDNKRKKVLNAYFDYKDKLSTSYLGVSGTITAPSDTKASITSVFRSKIKIFSTRQNLSEMLSYSNFDINDIGKKKTAVMIVVQDEKTTYHGLVTILIKQIYESLIEVAQHEKNGKLKHRTNFILDEFANMPPLKDVDSMVSAARSRAIRMYFIIQNYAQLEGVYGKQIADTIKGNVGNTVYLISTELAALEEISKLCGNKEGKKDDKVAESPLITVSDLQRLPMYTLIILRSRCAPFKTKVVPFWQMDLKGQWGKRYPRADFFRREAKPVKVFNILEAIRKKEAEANANSDNEGSNFSSGDIISPFKKSNDNSENNFFSQNSLFQPNSIFKDYGSKENENPFKNSPLNSKNDEIIKNSLRNIEEKYKKEAEVAKNNEVDNILNKLVTSLPDTNIIGDNEINKSNITTETKPEVKKPLFENKIIKFDIPKTTDKNKNDFDKTITDDQFFDDFFN